jgi:hypothetical protein
VTIVRRLMLLGMLAALLLPGAAYAQADDGQFCVQAYEDRNGNGQLDPGEPPITRSIGANLIDANGVIIATGLLDTSPTAARGVICFLNLPVGQYTMMISSADFEPTGSDNMTVNISGQGLPTIFEYGAQRIDVEAFPAEGTGRQVDQRQALERILVAGLGGALTMVIVGFIGLVLYLLVLRQRTPRPEPIDPNAYYMRPPPTTGSMPPVQPPTGDTGEYPEYPPRQ